MNVQQDQLTDIFFMYYFYNMGLQQIKAAT